MINQFIHDFVSKNLEVCKKVFHPEPTKRDKKARAELILSARKAFFTSEEESKRREDSDIIAMLLSAYKEQKI